jgi:hypothetical protein
MTDDWRKPYRSQDESGSPEAAGSVGHAWLVEIARAEHAANPRGLEVDFPICARPKHGVLYRDCALIAAYFVIRDPMNFAILIRWRAEEST